MSLLHFRPWCLSLSLYQKAWTWDLYSDIRYLYTHVQKAPLHANARIAWANHTTNDRVCTFKLSKSWILILSWIRNLVGFRRTYLWKASLWQKSNSPLDISLQPYFAWLWFIFLEKWTFLESCNFTTKYPVQSKDSRALLFIFPIIYLEPPVLDFDLLRCFDRFRLALRIDFFR